VKVGERCPVNPEGLSKRHDLGRLDGQPQLPRDSPVEHARDGSRVDQEIEVVQLCRRSLDHYQMPLDQIERHVARAGPGVGLRAAGFDSDRWWAACQKDNRPE
jgi:hypothetical protein